MSLRTPRIYYLAPDLERPSWGVALLYHHVAMLRRHGLRAAIVHLHRPFRPAWIDFRVPVRYLNSRFFRPRPDDVLVVPEILAGRPSLAGLRCRRWVFVQGAFLVLAKLDGERDYAELGYEGAIAILPHVREVVERHLGVAATVIPPFIAPYFFRAPDGAPRARRILLYPKEGSRDVEALRKLLRRELARRPGWSLVELDGLSHRAVAAAMGESALYVCVNCREAFNTTVPEAMAAGCVVVCYEAYGGRDYLRDGDNAYVFPNHHLFPLIDKTLALVDGYEALGEELESVRARAYSTACRYTEERTEAALLPFVRGLLA